MIYTVGHTKSYEQYFLEKGVPRKRGRTKDYVGGSVWKTYKEAEAHCRKGYSVYGVLADWDKETKPNKEGFCNDLLYDRALIKINNKPINTARDSIKGFLSLVFDIITAIGEAIL